MCSLFCRVKRKLHLNLNVRKKVIPIIPHKTFVFRNMLFPSLGLIAWHVLEGAVGVPCRRWWAFGFFPSFHSYIFGLPSFWLTLSFIHCILVSPIRCSGTDRFPSRFCCMTESITRGHEWATEKLPVSKQNGALRGQARTYLLLF